MAPRKALRSTRALRATSCASHLVLCHARNIAIWIAVEVKRLHPCLVIANLNVVEAPLLDHRTTSVVPLLDHHVGVGPLLDHLVGPLLDHLVVQPLLDTCWTTVTVGPLLDHLCWTTVGPPCHTTFVGPPCWTTLLDHCWTTVGPLLDYLVVPPFLTEMLSE